MQADHAAFVKRGIIILVYVDDISLFTTTKELMNATKSQLLSSYSMTDLGPLREYLGIQIDRDRTAGTITLSQAPYIYKVLNHFGYVDGHKVASPIDSKALFSPNSSTASTEAIKDYQSKIGTLSWIALISRLDISYPVNVLAQFAANPSQEHATAVSRVFRYLRSTINLSNRYSNGDLYGFTDANWAGGSAPALNMRRSTSAYIFFLAGGPISWSSKRQRTVATSSCESEYIGQCNASKEAVWLRLFLHEAGYPQLGPTTVNADNKSAIAIASNPEYHARTKHIDIQYHYVREKTSDGTVEFNYIPTAEIAADGLTKALKRVKFERWVALLRRQGYG
jgi:Reverse transcriptase (RNA-dependent DNA polymerase)